MSFDSMAAAVDWLDAYAAGDLNSLLGMYADDAVTECECGGMKSISGKAALRAYWTQRFKDYPASSLHDLQHYEGGATISYLTSKGIVSATMEFDPVGLIKLLRCGSSS